MTTKLTYFNVRGLGEAIRYFLNDQGIAYEEKLVASPAEWAPIKSSFLYGQIPCMEFDGLVLTQSNTILRHLGRLHDLYGSNDVERALIDQLMDGQDDVRKKYVSLIYTNYDAGKAEYIAGLEAAMAPFEKQLSANNGGSGYFVGNKISFADYKMFDFLDIHLVLSPTCLDNYPLLKAFHARMAARPNIAKYRQTEAFRSRPINGNDKQ